VTLDIVGNGFRTARRFPGLVVLVEVIQPKALQRRVGPPSAVPAFEFGAQKSQVVEPLDERDAFEPFVLEGLNDPLGYGDRSVLSYGAETRLDVPLFQ